MLRGWIKAGNVRKRWEIDAVEVELHIYKMFH